MRLLFGRALSSRSLGKAQFFESRGRGGLAVPERQVGFWEVGGVDGLPEEAHYAPQQEIYHVTDVASLIGCAPREAAELMRRLRDGDVGAEWEMSELPVAPDAMDVEGAPPPDSARVPAHVAMIGGQS